MPSKNAASPAHLARCLSATDLVLLGVGAIIGAGIFVLTGIASATQAGPAIILSFLLGGVACIFSALAYSELAASMGGCGGAYGYALKGVGEWLAWLVGWDLLMEYGMDAATVASGWSGYMQSALTAVGIHLPVALTTNPFNGGVVNLPAVFVIFMMALVLTRGTKTGARFNNAIVAIKLLVIALFIGIAAFHFNPANWHPFMPFGVTGIVQGAGLIFFAYIGFDAVATAAEETRNPQRDLPIGIIGSLLICTLVYIVVAGLLTGMAYYPSLNVSSPVAAVLLRAGYHLSGTLVALGAIAGLTTGILVMYYSATRVYLAMARDQLLPQTFLKIDARTHSPNQLVWFMGIIMAVVAGFFPIAQIADLVNISTLAAFVAVCGLVMLLRRTQPHMPRPFRMPAGIVFSSLGILFCGYIMMNLPVLTWMGYGIWMLMGLAFYWVRRAFVTPADG